MFGRTKYQLCAFRHNNCYYYMVAKEDAINTLKKQISEEEQLIVICTSKDEAALVQVANYINSMFQTACDNIADTRSMFANMTADISSIKEALKHVLVGILQSTISDAVNQCECEHDEKCSCDDTCKCKEEEPKVKKNKKAKKAKKK